MQELYIDLRKDRRGLSNLLSGEDSILFASSFLFWRAGEVFKLDEVFDFIVL